MNKVKNAGKLSLSDSVLELFDLKFLPRWVILVIDILLLLMSLLVSHLLILELNVKHYNVFPLFYVFLAIIGTNVLYMYIFKTYLGVIPK